MDHSPEMAALIAKYPSIAKAIETGIESHNGREQAMLTFILTHPSLPQIKNSPANLLAAVDEFSTAKDFLISIDPHKAGILFNLIAKEKPSMIVELGGYLGYSAILFADTMRRNHVPGQELRSWSIEINDDFVAIARQLIGFVGLSDIVTVVVGRADDSLRRLKEDDCLENISFLFLDHVEELYGSDFSVCENLGLLQKGAVVVADNVVRPGAPEYWKMAREHPRLRSVGVRGLIQPGDLEDELEISYVVSD